VYDINSKCVVHLSPLPSPCSFTETDLDVILGPRIADDTAIALCEEARIDPHTMEPFPRPSPQDAQQQQRSKKHWHGSKGRFGKDSGLEPYVPRYPDIRAHIISKDSSAKSVRQADSEKSASRGKEAKEEGFFRKRKEPPGLDVVSMIATSMLGIRKHNMVVEEEPQQVHMVDDDDDEIHEEIAAGAASRPQPKRSHKLFSVALEEQQHTRVQCLQERPEHKHRLSTIMAESEEDRELLSTHSARAEYIIPQQCSSEHRKDTGAQSTPVAERRALFSVPAASHKTSSASMSSSKTPPTQKKKPG
jgi:hypothetical protein